MIDAIMEGLKTVGDRKAGVTPGAQFIVVRKTADCDAIMEVMKTERDREDQGRTWCSFTPHCLLYMWMQTMIDPITDGQARRRKIDTQPLSTVCRKK